jgi:hypothetical protein
MAADRPTWKVALLVGATLLSLTIALATRPFVHPDERLHVEAFRYYATHAWPPDLNSSALVYDSYGTSKVYAREIVYTILGPPGRLAGSALGRAHPALAFRLLNVALLPLALAALLRVRSRIVPAGAIAVVIASLPQVLYVFGYANSDAWAVFLSILLFAQTLRLADAAAPWPLPEMALLGGLTGLLLASKDNFLLALALPAVLLAPRIAAAGRRGLVLFFLLAALIPAPYKIVYPLTQPDFAGATWRMSEERAAPGFKPSDPSRASLPPAGDSAWDVLVHGDFAVRTAQSLWGVYGHMNVFHAKGVYVGVGLLALLNVALTARTAWRRWTDLPAELRRLLLAAPCVMLANFVLSLRWAVEVFYQPQGRYLFPALIPAALLLVGTLAHEDSGRRARVASAGLALALAAWSLLFLALPALAL